MPFPSTRRHCRSRASKVGARASAGAASDAEVRVHSLQRRRLYRFSDLNHWHAHDPDTLLALAVNGEALDIDHGYPLRLIGPNRPGVQQTKWVTRLVVR